MTGCHKKRECMNKKKNIRFEGFEAKKALLSFFFFSAGEVYKSSFHWPAGFWVCPVSHFQGPRLGKPQHGCQGSTPPPYAGPPLPAQSMQAMVIGESMRAIAGHLEEMVAAVETQMALAQFQGLPGLYLGPVPRGSPPCRQRPMRCSSADDPPSSFSGFAPVPLDESQDSGGLGRGETTGGSGRAAQVPSAPPLAWRPGRRGTGDG